MLSMTNSLCPHSQHTCSPCWAGQAAGRNQVTLAWDAFFVPEESKFRLKLTLMFKVGTRNLQLVGLSWPPSRWDKNKEIATVAQPVGDLSWRLKLRSELLPEWLPSKSAWLIGKRLRRIRNERPALLSHWERPGECLRTTVDSKHFQAFHRLPGFYCFWLQTLQCKAPDCDYHKSSCKIS